ncbi:hemolysin family protein [Rhodococcoides kyotonense]|uniref:Hemolysin, contains CBS domains n=1 Tax=Rhodococcoides kyotonense TaxID=398843 RepID=A0A239JQX9_9NOCA|nr:hemolysin family protein [Rhodococcus kyotonensis]SNT08257.1 Hemolysin, contains CBS domains [Rhodococcus kyotonensis]
MGTLVSILSLVGFVALTAGTALFVAAEFSLTALEKSAVDSAATTSGDIRSRQVQRAHRTLSFQLSGAQLGITITTLITGYLAEPVLARFFVPVATALGASEGVASGLSLAVALIVATSFSMIFGELVPKNIAIAKPMATARATAGAMAGFSAVFRWAINGLNGSANMLVRRLGVEPAEELRSARSPRELSSLVRTSAQHGSLDEGTARLVGRSLQFGERTAEELMTPRVKVESLSVSDTASDLIETASRTGFSRFPVVDGDLDDTVGVVHLKHAFAVPAARRRDTRLDSLAQDVPVVPSSLDGDSVMERVRSDGMQVALVVDEYGGTAGMVTMEDLIEEILGDVHDEHDEPEIDVLRFGDGWLCSGLLRIDEVAAATGYSAPEGEYETIGGLVLSELGRIPVEGDKVVLPHSSSDDAADSRGGWVARVTRMDGRRIDRIMLQPVAAETVAHISAEEKAHG